MWMDQARVMLLQFPSERRILLFFIIIFESEEENRVVDFFFLLGHSESGFFLLMCFHSSILRRFRRPKHFLQMVNLYNFFFLWTTRCDVSNI